jgi:hypothetical protein
LSDEPQAADGYNHQTPEGGVPLAGADPVLLEDPVTDALMRMVTELTAELWVERDRRMVLEDVLVDAGVIDLDKLESYVPQGARGERFAAERHALVQSVFKELRRIVATASAELS